MPLSGHTSLPQETQALPQIQADEIEALQSILGPDFVPGRLASEIPAPWGNAGNTQPIFTLIVRPDEDNYKDHVWVKVEIRLPKRYPQVPLIFSVPSVAKDGLVQNVSAQQLALLASALKKRAVDLAARGEEAMWEVYSFGSEFLSNHNSVRDKEIFDEAKLQARKQSESVLSLDEEKQKREGEGQKIKAEELDRQLEADRKTSAEKASSLAKLIAEREQAIRAEKERRKVNFQLEGSQEEETQRTFIRTDSVETLPSSIADAAVLSTPSQSFEQGRDGSQPKLSDILIFDPPLLISGCSVSRFVATPALQDDQGSISASQFAAPICTLPLPVQALDTIRVTSPYFSTSRGRRKLAGLERELEALSNVDHHGLRPMRGFHLRRLEGKVEPDGTSPTEQFSLSIISAPRSQEEIRLDSLLRLQALPVLTALSLAKDLLAATAELHNRGLLLKDVTLDRVCVLPDKEFIVDSIWKGSVLELNRGNPLREGLDIITDPWPKGWIVPELQSELRYSRKSDTFVIGRILLLSVTGIAALTTFQDPWDAMDTLRRTGTIDETAAKFLGKVLDRSARKRPSSIEASKYLESVFETSVNYGEPSSTMLASTYRDSLATSVLEAGSPPKALTPAHQRSSFFSSHQPPPSTTRDVANTSRFLSDFIPLSILGKGAFGIVSKVKNRLDGGVYAVKKIKLDGGLGEGGEGEEKTLREIGALARVNHPHVTRYYAAWIEEAASTSANLENELSDTNTESAGVTTSSSSVADTDTDTDAAAQASFSLSFGPPKDADFDDLARAEEEDFLSHVGFEAEDGDSSQCSGSETADDSSDDEIDNVAARGKGSRQVMSRSKSKNATEALGVKRPPRWLYIQMELVDDVTLRELIEKGPICIEDCWRLLRQILNALVHIHNLGIVHRDLKPSNILMAGQDVKIGDFGLATTLETIPTVGPGGALVSSGFLASGSHQQHHHLQDSSGRMLLESSNDMTGEVGTALYTAPEIVRRQGVRYGYKVDMYSLGIILFEMVASGRIYSTGMERVQRLRALRQPIPEFPPAWPSELVKERQVIEWLVTHKAEDRPTPLELLQSDLLPPRLEDESVQETLRLVTDPSSVYHFQLLDALFAPRPASDEEIRDVTFDAGSQPQISKAVGGDAPPPLVDPRESVVIDFLRMVFLRHGAVELQTPLLMPPRSDLYSSRDGPTGVKPVQLLDSTGQVVYLPRDHLIPFARTIARSENHRLKRYCIGPVYRDALLPGGQPVSIRAANMDIIVGSGGSLPSAAEGECLACIEEILGEVPGFKDDWVVLINHGTILDLLLERVPVKEQSTVLSALSALSGRQPGSTTTSARHKLTQQLNLPKSLADELEACASMAEDIETAQSRLERILPVDHRPALARAIADIFEVRAAARKFGVPVERKYLLCPLLSNYSHCYKGSVFFQIARGTGSSGRKKRRARWDVVASGGRYTSLIARFSTPLSGPPPSGVGLQLAVSKLVSSLAKDQEINELRRPPDLWTPRRADVYVHSSPGMLDLRMSICRELWSHGIRADLSYEDDIGQESSMLTTAARCKEEGFSFLVFGTTRGLMKVRNLWTKMAEGEFSSMLELVPWLAEQLARASASVSVGGGTYGSGGFDSTGVGALTSETQGITGSVSGILPSSTQLPTSINSSGPDSMLSSGTTGLAPAMMETQIVLPVHSSASRRPDKADKSNHSHPDRRVKLASNHPIISSVTSQVHRMASSFASGEVPVIAVDLKGDVFDALCVAAMGKGSTRRDIGWRAFFDTLSSGEEREYAKSIRGHIERCGDGMVILWSIREKRAAVVGSTGPAG